MTSRQLNMIRAAEDGIKAAREKLAEPGKFEAMMDAMRNDMPWDDEDTHMGVARAAYLAYIYLAWKEADCPDP